MSPLPDVFHLRPTFHKRVWGGRRLLPASTEPIGEAWLVHDNNAVVELPGETLASLAHRDPRALYGAPPHPARFPLLIKLLDCHDWLSVQVHPDDAQAVALEGPGQLGKTEAWHVLDAVPGAELIAGTLAGVTDRDLHSAIRAGRVMDVLQRHRVAAGDTFYIPAGTVHALGPGLLVYEVQQSSDITYRVWDWDRPASAGRTLHIDKSMAVARARTVAPGRVAINDAHINLVSSPYFQLSRAGHEPKETDGPAFVQGVALPFGAQPVGLSPRFVRACSSVIAAAGDLITRLSA